jgi:hypothetical protein
MFELTPSELRDLKSKVLIPHWMQKNGIILARMELNAYFCS